MAVDKFGRYVSTGKRKVTRGPKGDGFLLTTDGDYNIQNKRLKLVNDPVDESDAVNLKALRGNAISLNSNGAFDASNKRITKVSDPVVASDCVTKSYFLINSALKHTSTKSYSFHQYSIKDVAFPLDDGDVVNLKYVKDNCLNLDHGTGKVNVKGAILSNVRDPIQNSDGATRAYVDSRVPYITKSYWHFRNRRLVNVADPKDKQDTVTLQYLKDNALCKPDNALKQFDGKSYTISNIAKPLQLDDAVNKRYIKEVMADLGYAVYSNIHKGRASLTPADQWKSQVLDTTSWDDLFK